MKYSFNWLKEISGTKLSAEKAAEFLTMKSMEVEGVTKIGGVPEGILVGEIMEIAKHPNADKLQLTKINVGTNNYLSIVCGAPNIKVGDKVPVATIGTILPGDFIIKEAEIRGEKSLGMLCSEKELGLGEENSGILIFSKHAKVGEKAGKYISSEDSVIEIKILPDRAHDAMSHVGVGREIAALSGKKMDYDFDGLKLPNIKNKNSENNFSIKIKDKKLCPRYIGAIMKDIEIKDSPDWMKSRLIASGMRPINNIVDATNYVMLELGQPLHAFDIENVKDEKSKIGIVVRRAEEGEKMILLDDTEVKLDNNDLLITNGETPLALAGVMGGKNSGINDNTRTILIEAANFQAGNIRRTRAKLGLRTESSDRYEKNIDPNITEKALSRIIEILEHTANGKLETIIDEYPEKVNPWKINLEQNYITSLLGEDVSVKEIVNILELIGIETKLKNSKTKKSIIECTIPTFRVDLKTQEDLIEEIGRLCGYEKIDSCPIDAPVIPARRNEIIFFERKIQDILTGYGFDEMYNYSFYSRLDAQRCKLAYDHCELFNPMNPDQELIRASLLPNILNNVRDNLKNFNEFNIFEIGKTYHLDGRKLEGKRMLVMAQVLEKDKNAETFYGLKGALEDVFEKLSIKSKDVSFKKIDNNISQIFHPERAAEIFVSGTLIGFVFEVEKEVLEKYKIIKRVAMVEINLKKLSGAIPKIKTYEAISKFPTVTRDISMIIPETIGYSLICDLVRKIGGKLIRSVSLFDYFEAKKSLAIRIEFGTPDRTLESAEIDRVMEKIVSKLEKELKVEIRK